MEFWDLRVNGSCEPIGVAPCRPQFSFRCRGDGLFWASVSTWPNGEDEQELAISTPENCCFFFPSPLRGATNYLFSVSNGWHIETVGFETCITAPANFFHLKEYTTLTRGFWVPHDFLRARLYLFADGEVNALVNQERLGKGYAADIEQGGMSKNCHTYPLEGLLWSGIENRVSFSTEKKPAMIAAEMMLWRPGGKRQHLIL